MKHITLALTLTTGLLTSASSGQAPIGKVVTYCPADVQVDYELIGISYYARLMRDASCKPGDLTRIRKTSTMSQIKNGARYQPILPLKGAWAINDFGVDDVPQNQQWTLYSWDWQWYDGKVWKKAVTQ